MDRVAHADRSTKLEAFVERAIGDLAAGYGGVMVSLGHKLGLYKAMAARARSSRASWQRAAAAPSATCASG